MKNFFGRIRCFGFRFLVVLRVTSFGFLCACLQSGSVYAGETRDDFRPPELGWARFYSRGELGVGDTPTTFDGGLEYASFPGLNRTLEDSSPFLEYGFGLGLSREIEKSSVISDVSVGIGGYWASRISSGQSCFWLNGLKTNLGFSGEIFGPGEESNEVALSLGSGVLCRRGRDLHLVLPEITSVQNLDRSKEDRWSVGLRGLSKWANEVRLDYSAQAADQGKLSFHGEIGVPISLLSGVKVGEQFQLTAGLDGRVQFEDARKEYGAVQERSRLGERDTKSEVKALFGFRIAH